MNFEAVWNMADELRDVLPIFTLTEPERREIVSHMHVRRFDAGEVVYHRGDPAGDIFLVHRGLLKSLLHDEEGHELLVTLLGRGEFFGTLCLFNREDRESTITAIAPATVLQIARADALRVLERNPGAMHFLFGRFAWTIQELTALVEKLVFLDVPRRVAQYLLELERFGHLGLTQEEIAAAVGTTRESVNKTLADLERRGLIRFERRHLRILDEARLRAELRS